MPQTASYFDHIREHLIENKVYIDLLIIAFGLMMLWGAVKDWNWIFGEVSRSNYSLHKLDGIINLFGRKTGRVICGLAGCLLIIIGVISIVHLIMYDESKP